MSLTVWALMVRYEHSFMSHEWQQSNIAVSSFADCVKHLGRHFSCGGFVEYRAVFVCSGA